MSEGTQAAAPRFRATVNDIKLLAAQAFGVTTNDINSRRRDRRSARPRQVAMWLAKHATPLSYPEIGREFGDRDHTTVMAACKVVEAIRAHDAGLRATLDRLLSDMPSPAAPPRDDRRIRALTGQIVSETAALTQAVSALVASQAELLAEIRKGNHS